jgi:undecaprenyl-diphosphatase
MSALAPLYTYDKALFYLVNRSWHNPFFDWLMPYITDIKNFKLLLIIFAVWLFIRGKNKGRRVVILAVVALALSDLMASQVLKYIFHRGRPCQVLSQVRLLIRCSNSYSFPSSHAANIFAVTGVLSTKYKKALFPLLVSALLVAYSRIYVGVHYPLDVAAGAGIGIFMARLTVWGEKILDPRWQNLWNRCKDRRTSRREKNEA